MEKFTEKEEKQICVNVSNTEDIAEDDMINEKINLIKKN